MVHWLKLPLYQLDKQMLARLWHFHFLFHCLLFHAQILPGNQGHQWLFHCTVWTAGALYGFHAIFATTDQGGSASFTAAKAPSSSL